MRVHGVHKKKNKTGPKLENVPQLELQLWLYMHRVDITIVGPLSPPIVSNVLQSSKRQPYWKSAWGRYYLTVSRWFINSAPQVEPCQHKRETFWITLYIMFHEHNPPLPSFLIFLPMELPPLTSKDESLCWTSACKVDGLGGLTGKGGSVGVPQATGGQMWYVWKRDYQYRIRHSGRQQLPAG